MALRFSLKISSLVRPLLLPLGVTRDRAYLELDERALLVRFGALFEEKIPIEAILEAREISWNVLQGVGLKLNLRGKVGVIGSTDGVISLRFREPIRVHALLVVSCEELCVSLEDPLGFLGAIRPLLAVGRE